MYDNNTTLKSGSSQNLIAASILRVSFAYLVATGTSFLLLVIKVP